MELTASVLAAPTTSTGEARVLVVLPSLGTSVGALWQQAAMQLAELSPESTVIGIDLPGHGRSAPIDVPAGSTVAPRMTVRELAEAVQSTLAKILRSEEHTSELQSRGHLVCRLLPEEKNRR